MWRGCGEKGTLPHCWWECKFVHPLWKTVWMYFRKLNIELPYDPAIPLFGIYTDKTFIEKDACTFMFIAALLTIAKTWNKSKYPFTNNWIRKMWYIYTMESYSALKKNDTMPFAGTCYGTRDSHSEGSKLERERKIPCDINYILNLIYGTKESFHGKENHGLGE